MSSYQPKSPASCSEPTIDGCAEQDHGCPEPAAARQLAPDLATYDDQPRYRLRPLGGPAEAIELALGAYRDGQRALWFVNRVERAQALTRLLSEVLDTRVLCYHERFRLRDRRERRGEVVRAFDDAPGPCLALVTPLCEAELALDADLLLAELAPPLALLHRFVHGDRHRRRGTSFRAALAVYEERPEQPTPYTEESLEAARRFVQDLGEGDRSQRDLAAAFRRQPPLATRHTAAAHDRSVPCVLDGDLDEAAALHGAGLPLDDLLVPVPLRAVGHERPDWLPSPLGVVSSARYRPAFGLLLADSPG